MDSMTLSRLASDDEHNFRTLAGIPSGPEDFLIVLRNKNFSTSLKLRLFMSKVVSVLLHGCCIWKVSKNVTSRLQILINRCLKCIFRIYLQSQISNQELLQRTEIEPVAIRIRRQKSAWIRHTLRKGEYNIACMVMEWNPFDGLGRAPGAQCQM